MKIITFFKLLTYKFSRIENNYILFFFFFWKYADGPKALTESIHKLDESKKIIWLVNNIDNTNIPDYVLKVKYGSRLASKYYAKSKIIIDNVFGMHECYQESDSFLGRIKFLILSFLKNKKGQYVYTTWHGTPIKKMGIDLKNSNVYDFNCSNTTMILDNKYAIDILKRLTFNKIDFKLLGSPRNDLLLNNETSINELRRQLDLPNDKKILLFAPTFRTDDDKNNNINRSGIDQINMLDIKRLLNALKMKFGGDWILVCRFHYYVENAIDWEKIKREYGDKIINGNMNEDIVEYLKCADLLMTDISSSVFDFALTKKPILNFFPDLENYKNKERGLYIDFKDLPFKSATNFDELLNNINSFSYNDYLKKVNKMLNDMGHIKVKNASEKVAEFILKDGE